MVICLCMCAHILRPRKIKKGINLKLNLNKLKQLLV